MQASVRFSTLYTSVLAHALLFGALYWYSLSTVSSVPEEVYTVSLEEFSMPAPAQGETGVTVQEQGGEQPAAAPQPEAKQEPAPQLSKPAPAPKAVPKSTPKAPKTPAVSPKKKKGEPKPRPQSEPEPVPAKTTAGSEQASVSQASASSAASAGSRVQGGGGQGGHGGGVPGGGAGGGSGHGAGGPVARNYGGLMAYQQSEVDQRPSIRKSASVEYPSDARRRGIEGRAIVQLVVDTGGNPKDIRIKSASPQGYFEEAAMAAARKMRFIPGKIKGKTVNTLVLIPFGFSLR